VDKSRRVDTAIYRDEGVAAVFPKNQITVNGSTNDQTHLRIPSYPLTSQPTNVMGVNDEGKILYYIYNKSVCF